MPPVSLTDDVITRRNKLAAKLRLFGDDFEN
jgi:hypothetical protein